MEYGLNAGSCDNSYLVVGRSARVVVDVPDEAYLVTATVHGWAGLPMKCMHA